MAERKEIKKIVESEENLSNYSDEYLLDMALYAAGNSAIARSGGGPLSSTKFDIKKENFCKEILKRMKKNFAKDKPSIKNDDINGACDNMPDA